MDPFAFSSNETVEARTQPFDPIITDLLHEILVTLNYVILCGLVSVFGIVTNVINLVVFCKQGLDSSINITFFALAISDLSALVLQLVFNVYVNPWFERSDVLIVPSEFKYLTAGLPRTVFTRITCLITVHITIERCLCISFPLHINQLSTPRRTALAMMAIYTVTWLAIAPLYCTAYIGWKFYQGTNKTLLGLISTPDNGKLTRIVSLLLTLFGFALFAAVVIFTTILIRQLARQSKWRQMVNANQSKTETLSNRDMKTGRMVVLIASILIVCNTPTSILFGITFFVPEFSVIGRYQHLYMATWSFGFVFETINSSVNIFLYLKMSSKYRETFNEIFCN